MWLSSGLCNHTEVKRGKSRGFKTFLEARKFFLYTLWTRILFGKASPITGLGAACSEKGSWHPDILWRRSKSSTIQSSFAPVCWNVSSQIAELKLCKISSRIVVCAAIQKCHRKIAKLWHSMQKGIVWEVSTYVHMCIWQHGHSSQSRFCLVFQTNLSCERRQGS